MALPISVLDQSPIPEGLSGAEALRNSIDLARLAEALGYRRYWVAEHHGTPGLASASPEALIGPIAAATEKIRVGSGGVMLPHYSPLKVAETFTALAGIFPGRIDLGFGRAPGTDPMTTYALQRDRREAAPDDFPEQMAELLGYLNDDLPASHPFARLAATLPGLPERPEPWLLGSSPQSGIWAAELGLPYAFADFINSGGAEIAAQYREDAERPYLAVATWAICADTEEEAQRLASSSRMTMRMLAQGRLIAVPSVEKAMRYLAAQGSAPAGDRERRRRATIGDPEQVRAGLEAVAAEYGADELMVVTITHDHQARRRSYELIADAFGTRPGATGRDAAVRVG
ncbi:MAG TPA: LLM class flavin-dependent oxidoreductase [Solirubrobacteraceae bacterium]|jgi:luciferase family oxidoreductase group 1|nr:LLM class flavin-dependent oxidoreductase [Solirubrobacteraceae bacterium]